MLGVNPRCCYLYFSSERLYTFPKVTQRVVLLGSTGSVFPEHHFLLGKAGHVLCGGIWGCRAVRAGILGRPPDLALPSAVL